MREGQTDTCKETARRVERDAGRQPQEREKTRKRQKIEGTVVKAG